MNSHWIFYFIAVPGGLLSTKLATLKAGDTIKVAPKATGLLTLRQLPAAKKLFLLATGTGIGPFLSIIKTVKSGNSLNVLPWSTR